MTTQTPESPIDTNLRRHTWSEFRDTGLLWLINRTLHVFGWVIVVEVDCGTGEVVIAYPARTPWRGFDEAAEARGFKRVSEWLRKAGDVLADECER